MLPCDRDHTQGLGKEQFEDVDEEHKTASTTKPLPSSEGASTATTRHSNALGVLRVAALKGIDTCSASKAQKTSTFHPITPLGQKSAPSK